MAKRRAILGFHDLTDFLSQWEEQIESGSVVLPPDTVDGELARAFKLDLELPMVGRVGPIEAQVLQEMPDGSIAAQLPDIPKEVQQGVERLLGFVDEVKQYLVEGGALVEPGSEKAQATVGDTHSADAPPTVIIQQVSGRARPGDGFTLPDVGDRVADNTGDLQGRSFRDFLVQLAVERATGLLTVVQGDGTRKFGFWQKGGPVGWRSEPVDKEEVLGVLLLKAGHVDKEQLERSLEVMEEMVCRQGEAFIEMGVLTFAQLVMVLQKQSEFVLQRVMRDREGIWAFHKIDELPEPFITPPLRVPSVLYQALRDHAKELPAGRLQKTIKPNLDRYVGVSQGGEAVLGDINWTKDEKKFLEIMRENSWRIRELFSVSPMSRHMTSCVLWSLEDLGFLTYKETEDLERYLERIGTRIMGKASRVVKANHFDVLELHWICQSPDVEEAYQKLKAEFQLDQYENLLPEMVKAIEVIQKFLDEAFEAVHKDAQRRAYRTEIVEKDTIKQSAELLARKGEMAIMKNDRKEATNCWGKALELVPHNSAFREGYQRALAAV